MAASSPLRTVLTFIAITALVAGVATVLPVDKTSEEAQKMRDFHFAYKAISEPLAATQEEREAYIFDFLKLSLSPTVLEQSNKVARSRSTMINRATSEKTELDRSPSNFIVVTENTVGAEVSKQSVAAELAQRESSLKSKNVTGCNSIESKYSAQNCRDEVYFQKAISTKDSKICESIVNSELELRCQNYVDLIPKYEVAS